MLSPFKTKGGRAYYKLHIHGFNPDNLSNLAFPTWVALRRLPFEHHDQTLAIAKTLGEVIGIDTANETAKDPRFCINLIVSRGWVTNIDLETEGGVLPVQKVLVDYDKLPMRCKACHSSKHRVRDCKETQKKLFEGRKETNTCISSTSTRKRKNILIDEDGFQQVRNQKNTRRNIFDIVNNDMRSNDTSYLLTYLLILKMWRTMARSRSRAE